MSGSSTRRRGGSKGPHVIGKLKGVAPARLKPRINASSEPARTYYGDGGNLYLVVEKTGSRHWAFVYRERHSGKSTRQEIGLGSFLNVTTEDARERAAELRRLIGQGIDPKAATAAAKAQSRTFGDVAEEYLEKRVAVSGQNAKHVYQWRATLTEYCEPIRAKPVSKISADDVLAVMMQTTIGDRDLGGPFWTVRHETASRLRGRIETVLDYAMTKGMLTGVNPARLQGALKGALRGLNVSKPETHLAALPYTDVPAFMRELRTRLPAAVRVARARRRFCNAHCKVPRSRVRKETRVDPHLPGFRAGGYRGPPIRGADPMVRRHGPGPAEGDVPFEIVGRFRDIQSGKADDRPELAKAIRLARSTGAELLVAKLDRLSRRHRRQGR